MHLVPMVEGFQKEGLLGGLTNQQSIAARIWGIWPRLERASARDPQGALRSPLYRSGVQRKHWPCGTVKQWFNGAVSFAWLHPDRKASPSCAMLFIGCTLGSAVKNRKGFVKVRMRVHRRNARGRRPILKGAAAYF